MTASATGFRCYLVTKSESGTIEASVTTRNVGDLPPGQVLIRVEYSSLNYKDGLSASAHPGVTRKFPHVPGIDAAGTVVESQVEVLRPGDPVLVTGYDLGQNTWGGFAEFVRVPSEWVVKLPSGLTLRESMAYGTAGFTAGLCVATFQRHGIRADQGEIVVTGASGGVGCLAVAILSRLGYSVVASTGKPAAHEFLTRLGANRVVGRGEVDDRSDKPLLGTRWAGAVDTVGGQTLATLVRSLDRGGCVCACGLVGGLQIPLTVYPFLLRGVMLAGIASADTPRDQRLAVWRGLAGDWKPAGLESVSREVTLDGLPDQIRAILAGEILGRVIVRPG